MLNVFKKGPQMTDKVVMYFVYLALSIALTVWVGRALSRNGKVFLEDAFADERLAGSVNQLLVVGFYLLNLGYVSVAMRDSDNISDSSIVMEQLSRKVGLVLLVLGVIHFFNLYALSRYRRTRMRAATGVPPLPPAAVIRPQPSPADPRAQEQARAQVEAQMHAQQQYAQARAAAGWQQPGQPANQPPSQTPTTLDDDQ
jgi:hypothetical protein